jgi:hypothetical protein
MGQRLMGLEPFMIVCQVIVITKENHFLELSHQAKIGEEALSLSNMVVDM